MLLDTGRVLTRTETVKLGDQVRNLRHLCQHAISELLLSLQFLKPPGLEFVQHVCIRSWVIHRSRRVKGEVQHTVHSRCVSNSWCVLMEVHQLKGNIRILFILSFLF